MEITGTMYKVLPSEQITFGDGTTTTKGAFVIMRSGEFAKPVHFEAFGAERVAAYSELAVGTPVLVNFYAESHEDTKGRYFTNLRCSSVVPLDGQHPKATIEPQTMPLEEIPDPFDSLQDDSADPPF